MAGSTVRKQGTVSRLKPLLEKQNHVPQMPASWDKTTLPTIISNYKLENIYNADEFGLFYQLALPDKTLHFKSEKCLGGKHSKTRLTGMAAANAAGENLLMFVIGKSARPGVLLALETSPANTDRIKRVGWTACCSKSGSGSSTERFREKAEKLPLSWIIAWPTHTLKG